MAYIENVLWCQLKMNKRQSSNKMSLKARGIELFMYMTVTDCPHLAPSDPVELTIAAAVGTRRRKTAAGSALGICRRAFNKVA